MKMLLWTKLRSPIHMPWVWIIPMKISNVMLMHSTNWSSYFLFAGSYCKVNWEGEVWRDQDRFITSSSRRVVCNFKERRIPGYPSLEKDTCPCHYRWWWRWWQRPAGCTTHWIECRQNCVWCQQCSLHYLSWTSLCWFAWNTSPWSQQRQDNVQACIWYLQ